ncbi:30S ribosomal protein S8e [Candidatus Woesearchaeota archaeon]|nr:30S ribosomal protein S8e [Candidatus Woesearchaeota archaeon]
MVIVQARSKRKATGGRYKKQIILKRKYELGRSPSLIKLETSKKKVIRTKGGGSKIRLMSANILNIVGSDGKFKKTKIISVIENSANKNFVRRNIMTKGAIVETEAGKAKITNRPGQDGILNGVLI